MCFPAHSQAEASPGAGRGDPTDPTGRKGTFPLCTSMCKAPAAPLGCERERAPARRVPPLRNSKDMANPASRAAAATAQNNAAGKQARASGKSVEQRGSWDQTQQQPEPGQQQETGKGKHWESKWSPSPPPRQELAALWQAQHSQWEAQQPPARTLRPHTLCGLVGAVGRAWNGSIGNGAASSSHPPSTHPLWGCGTFGMDP